MLSWPFQLVLEQPRGLALASPLLSKLSQESQLRLGKGRLALHPGSGFAHGARAVVETPYGRRAIAVTLDASVPPGVALAAGTAGDGGDSQRGWPRQGGPHMNKRYGMSIDIDKCTGCGACMVACAVENNVPPALPGPPSARGITWMRVYKIDNGEEYPERRSAFVPMMCQQCGEETPCVHVCPQQAVEVDPATGIVGQMPERCLGCRYCMAACPYHARYFNWWDPEWPAGMEKTLNPGCGAAHARGGGEMQFLPRTLACAPRNTPPRRGSQEIQPDDYVPACVEACPTGAIRFGDLNDPSSEVAADSRDARQFPPARKAGHRSEDLLPVRSATGCGRSPTRRGPAGSGLAEWRTERRTLVDKAIHRARRETLLHRRDSCSGSRPGPRCWSSACTAPACAWSKA